jgi:hypothetical protein
MIEDHNSIDTMAIVIAAPRGLAAESPNAVLRR